ncbi:vesicle transport through interaction with t-SNAREs homolog 1B isoform X2 [Spea bombifrons]|uniref:vesicle transport through interaction with t-SNAREs homolog 1B isoform X2 n=1 Tax=Spea bombifrons TaxID=233779 RepID=UPI0023495C40|nr:vesicle transport through interaction with t-SNAREs homolog 1B isoform X2 [Spea bombifrons]
MSSERFERLHELYKEFYGSLQRITQMLQNSRGEEKKKLLREFDEKQQEANEMLVEMEEELKYAPPSFRHQMMSKLRTYKKDLVKLQMESKATNLEFGPSIASGDFKQGSYNLDNHENSTLNTQRALLIQGTQSLIRSSDSIARSHQIAAETDAIGSDIIEELGEQREQLERTKDRLVNTNENLSRSRRILRAMSRKLLPNCVAVMPG